MTNTKSYAQSGNKWFGKVYQIWGRWAIKESDRGHFYTGYKTMGIRRRAYSVVWGGLEL